MSFIEEHLRSEEFKNVSDEDLLKESQKLELRQTAIHIEQKFREMEDKIKNNYLIGKYFRYYESGETIYIKVVEYSSIPSQKGFYCKKVVVDEYSCEFMYETYDIVDFETMKEITEETYKKDLYDILDAIKKEYICKK